MEDILTTGHLCAVGFIQCMSSFAGSAAQKAKLTIFIVSQTGAPQCTN